MPTCLTFAVSIESARNFSRAQWALSCQTSFEHIKVKTRNNAAAKPPFGIRRSRLKKKKNGSGSLLAEPFVNKRRSNDSSVLGQPAAKTLEPSAPVIWAVLEVDSFFSIRALPWTSRVAAPSQRLRRRRSLRRNKTSKTPQDPSVLPKAVHLCTHATIQRREPNHGISESHGRLRAPSYLK